MPDILCIGNWHVDPSLRTLTGPSGEVHVEPKQMQVLLQLVEHAGSVVSKQQLLRTVWADTFVGDEVLSRAVSELRRVLDDDPKAPRYIQTIPKSGYRLVAPVRMLEVDASGAQPVKAVSDARVTGRQRWRHALAVWVIAPLVAAYAVWKIGDTPASTSEPSSSQRRTVPLTTLPGEEGAPSFSPDGMHIVFESRQGPGQESKIFVKTIGDNPPQALTQGARDGAPAWSPNGQSIAFVRNGWPAAGASPSYVAASGLYVMPVLGGPARRIYAGSLYGGPAWSPDGRTLVFAPELPGGGANLIELSLSTMETRPLTSGRGWDDFPVFSPDGRTVAFVRDVASARDMFVVPVRGGPATRLTFDDLFIWGRPAWSPDGKSLIYASSRSGSAELWRIAAGGGQPERLAIAGDAYDVAVARSGRRLAYVRGRGIKLNIAAFDLEDPRRLPVYIAESTQLEHSPSFSRDGKRIAFRSDRGGSSDIWIADADGRNPIRLTFSRKGFHGSPQWSPDGDWIAFDAKTEEGWHILAVRTAGGPPVQLTSGRSNDCVPTWSRDGRWIYFASDRTGDNQLWRMPSRGGEAVQITRGGAKGGFESIDGRYLYYTKSNGPGVWRIPASGGHEEPVLREDPVGAYERYWALVDQRLYYLRTRNESQQSVEVLDLTTHQTRRVLDLPRPACGSYSPDLAVSPDHRTLLTCFQSAADSDIMLVEYFE